LPILTPGIEKFFERRGRVGEIPQIRKSEGSSGKILSKIEQGKRKGY